VQWMAPVLSDNVVPRHSSPTLERHRPDKRDRKRKKRDIALYWIVRIRQVLGIKALCASFCSSYDQSFLNCIEKNHQPGVDVEENRSLRCVALRPGVDA
jgi:hypothetical protein